MDCPKCGYAMTDFDIDCPRCVRIALARSQAPPPSFSPSPLVERGSGGEVPPPPAAPESSATTGVTTIVNVQQRSGSEGALWALLAIIFGPPLIGALGCLFVPMLLAAGIGLTAIGLYFGPLLVSIPIALWIWYRSPATRHDRAMWAGVALGSGAVLSVIWIIIVSASSHTP